MKVLCTMPGKHGDSLWAAPTMRAIAEAAGEPVDLIMAPKYAGICPLYERQDYIDTAQGWDSWQVQDTAPMTPWSPFEETLHHEAIVQEQGRYDRVVHLGYRQWPTTTLPHFVYEQTRREYPDLPIAELDLETPWIQAAAWPGSRIDPVPSVVVGFSDEWFELKVGLVTLLYEAFRDDRGFGEFPPDRWAIVCGSGMRWDREWWDATVLSWTQVATYINTADVFLGCCSALHVLAAASGRPCIIVEPAEGRHNPIFWPFGMDGPRVTCVKGNDGKPTFHAPHVIDAVKAALEGQL